MEVMRAGLLLCFVVFALGKTNETKVEHVEDKTTGTLDEDKTIVRAVLESCPRCKLNTHHDVRDFVYDDVPLYHDVKFKRKPKASPVLQFLNRNYKIVEEVDLLELTRDECNNVLLERGFYRKENKFDEVPEEIIKTLQYKRKDEL